MNIKFVILIDFAFCLNNLDCMKMLT